MILLLILRGMLRGMLRGLLLLVLRGLLRWMLRGLRGMRKSNGNDELWQRCLTRHLEKEDNDMSQFFEDVMDIAYFFLLLIVFVILASIFVAVLAGLGYMAYLVLS